MSPSSVSGILRYLDRDNNSRKKNGILFQQEFALLWRGSPVKERRCSDTGHVGPGPCIHPDGIAFFNEIWDAHL